MATKLGPRSASEATRFTSTTPHASSKSIPRGPPPPGLRETPEERVRRLRAAHEAARNAQLSSLDKVVGRGRRFFDIAHRVTIAGLIGFTAIAGVFTVYSVYDMAVYNRKRRVEFIEAQKKIEADSLSSARLAFINGTATEEQITLVEEANARVRETGIKLPPLLGAPTAASAPVRSDPAAAPEAAFTSTSATVETLNKEKKGWWPFSSTSKEEDISWSEEDEVSGVRQGDLLKAAEERTEYIKDKARVAFEKEKENQRRGGALDQVGLDKKPVPEKKGWW